MCAVLQDRTRGRFHRRLQSMAVASAEPAAALSSSVLECQVLARAGIAVATAPVLPPVWRCSGYAGASTARRAVLAVLSSDTPVPSHGSYSSSSLLQGVNPAQGESRRLQVPVRTEMVHHQSMIGASCMPHAPIATASVAQSTGRWALEFAWCSNLAVIVTAALLGGAMCIRLACRVAVLVGFCNLHRALILQ